MLQSTYSLLQAHWLIVLTAAIALMSLLIARRAETVQGFFHGQDQGRRAPGLMTLVLSQTTTWIFARSLLNAAILGYYYGVWGTLAYTAYYLSFLTGGAIIDSLRFRHGYSSVQAFLMDHFGRTGTRCYNLVIGLRLISEVFANILVIGILFGAAGSGSYILAVVAFAVITLLYSMRGGLKASLRTDVLQMLLFLGMLALILLVVLGGGQLSVQTLTAVPFDLSEPGPILLLVALLQVWSYPLHDPVMMDRGFIADRSTTRRSFLHACWLSSLCIFSFGCLGIMAGVAAEAGEEMTAVLQRLLGEPLMIIFNTALVISAMSTLDSTLSSSAKLAVVDMRWLQPTLANGRMAMAGFLLAGLLAVFAGNEDLFSAVAVSGTASMYLAPVVFFCLWGGIRGIPTASYLSAFILSVSAAILYFLESSGKTALLGDAHKYTKLLWISLLVMLGSCLSFWIGYQLQKGRIVSAPDPAG